MKADFVFRVDDLISGLYAPISRENLQENVSIAYKIKQFITSCGLHRPLSTALPMHSVKQL